jgi:hypothetical protein
MLIESRQSRNERIAFEYRRSQLSVLSTVIFKLSTTVSGVFSASFDTKTSLTDPTNVMSLAKSFNWLLQNYPEIYAPIVQMISEDQEEPLPLNWDILVQDWDHTYWVVWIFTIWLLWARDGEAFQEQHPILGLWMVEMNR